MRFQLKKSGTITDCREALNAVIAEFSLPETQEQKVIRMIAHYTVADYLDPMHATWQAQCQALRGASLAEPSEPSAAIDIDCAISWGGA